MVWQDIIFSSGSFILLIALIPTILGKQKPEVSTSIVTGIILGAFSYSYYTLDLVFSSFITGLNSLAWFVLAFQRFKKNQ
jgi:hypothetical protein